MSETRRDIDIEQVQQLICGTAVSSSPNRTIFKENGLKNSTPDLNEKNDRNEKNSKNSL